mgnify:CR=1 FL=1
MTVVRAGDLADMQKTCLQAKAILSFGSHLSPQGVRRACHIGRPDAKHLLLHTSSKALSRQGANRKRRADKQGRERLLAESTRGSADNLLAYVLVSIRWEVELLNVANNLGIPR